MSSNIIIESTQEVGGASFVDNSNDQKTIHFEDERNVQVEDSDLLPSQRLTEHTQEHLKWTINELTTRYVHLDTATWTAADGMTLIGQWNYPFVLSKEFNYAANIIRMFTLAKIAPKFRIHVNTTKFHAGRLGLIWLPAGYPRGVVTLSEIVQLPHVIIDAATSNEGLLEVPFMTPYENISTFEPTSTNLGTLVLISLSKLVDSNGGTGSVKVSIFQAWNNAELQIPAPSHGLFKGEVFIAAQGVTDLTTYKVDFSNPVDLVTGGIGEQFFPNGENEMHIKRLAGRPTKIITMSFPQQGTTQVNLAVTPAVWGTVSSAGTTQATQPSLAQTSSLLEQLVSSFIYWNGSIRVTSTTACSKNVSGNLHTHYDPRVLVMNNPLEIQWYPKENAISSYNTWNYFDSMNISTMNTFTHEFRANTVFNKLFIHRSATSSKRTTSMFNAGGTVRFRFHVDSNNGANNEWVWWNLFLSAGDDFTALYYVGPPRFQMSTLSNYDFPDLWVWTPPPAGGTVDLSSANVAIAQGGEVISAGLAVALAGATVAVGGTATGLVIGGTMTAFACYVLGEKVREVGEKVGGLINVAHSISSPFDTYFKVVCGSPLYGAINYTVDLGMLMIELVNIRNSFQVIAWLWHAVKAIKDLTGYVVKNGHEMITKVQEWMRSESLVPESQDEDDEKWSLLAVTGFIGFVLAGGTVALGTIKSLCATVFRPLLVLGRSSRDLTSLLLNGPKVWNLLTEGVGKLTGTRQDMLTGIGTENQPVKEWAERALTVSDGTAIDQMRLHPELRGVVDTLFAQGLEFSNMKLPSGISSNVTKICARLMEVKAEIRKMENFTTTRPIPFGILLSGKAGTGKSEFSKEISEMLGRELLGTYEEGSMVYHRNDDDQFWSGYNYQPITIFDDLFFTEDEQKNVKEASEIKGCINTVPFLLTMADLKDKGKSFNSKVVIASTNFMRGVAGKVRDTDAFWRRFPIIMEFKLDSKIVGTKETLDQELKDELKGRNINIRDVILIDLKQKTSKEEKTIVGDLSIEKAKEIILHDFRRIFYPEFRRTMRYSYVQPMERLAQHQSEPTLAESLVLFGSTQYRNLVKIWKSTASNFALDSLAGKVAHLSGNMAMGDGDLPACLLENLPANDLQILQRLDHISDAVVEFELRRSESITHQLLEQLITLKNRGKECYLSWMERRRGKNLWKEMEKIVKADPTPFKRGEPIRFGQYKYLVECVTSGLYPEWIDRDAIVKMTPMREYVIELICEYRHKVTSPLTEIYEHIVHGVNMQGSDAHFFGELLKSGYGPTEIKTLHEQFTIENVRILKEFEGAGEGMWKRLLHEYKWLLTAVATLSALPLAYVLARMWKKEHVTEAETQSKDAATGKSSSRGYRSVRTIRNERIIMPNAQGKSSNLDDITAKIHLNSIILTGSDQLGKFRAIRGLGNGNFVVFIRHQIEKFDLKEPMTVHRFSREGKINQIGVRVEESSLKKIHGPTDEVTDLVLWDCEQQLNAFENLTKFLPEEEEMASLYSAVARLQVMTEVDLIKEDDMEVVFEDRELLMEPLTQTIGYLDQGKEILLRRGFMARGQFKSGDCGSVYVCKSSKFGHKILGFHVAGIPVSDKGFASVLTKKMFIRAVQERTPLYEGFEEVLYGETEEEEFYDTSDVLFEEVGEMKIRPCQGIEVLGKMPHPVFLPTTTNITESPHFEKIFPNHVGPTVLSGADPRLSEENRGKSPLKRGIDQIGTTVIPLEKELIIKASDHLLEQLLPYGPPDPRVLTVEEAINGNPKRSPYIRGLDKTTSPGLPYIFDPTYTKNPDFKMEQIEDPQSIFWALLKDRLAKAKEGKKVPSVWNSCLKEEKTKIEKIENGKTRVFMIAPMDNCVAMKMYFGDFNAAMTESRLETFFSIGINPESIEWEQLYHRFKDFSDYCTDIDYQAFDSLMLPAMIYGFLRIVNGWYRKRKGLKPEEIKEDERVRRILINEVCYTQVNALDCVYLMNRGNPSGCAITAIVNSVVNALYIRIAWMAMRIKKGLSPDLKIFDREYIDSNYGDDLLLGAKVDTSVTVQEICDWLTEQGIVTTSADKKSKIRLKTIEECTFLKRGFCQEKKGGRITPTLEKRTIYGLVNWYKKSKYMSENESVACNLYTALGFLSFWRDRDYQKLYQFIVDEKIKVPYLPPERRSMQEHVLHSEKPWDHHEEYEINARIPITAQGLPLGGDAQHLGSLKKKIPEAVENTFATGEAMVKDPKNAPATFYKYIKGNVIEASKFFSNILGDSPLVMGKQHQTAPHVETLANSVSLRAVRALRAGEASERELTEKHQTPVDELDILNLVRKPTIIYTQHMAYGTDFKFGIPVTPFFGIPTDSGLSGTPLGYYSSFFNFWRGSLEYVIDIIAPAFITGRVLVSWVPDPDPTVLTMSLEQLSSFPSYVMDLHEQRQFCFRVPYLTTTVQKTRTKDDTMNMYSTFTHNGVVIITSLNTVVASSATATGGFDVWVWARAGPDYSLSCPITPSDKLATNQLDWIVATGNTTGAGALTPDYSAVSGVTQPPTTGPASNTPTPAVRDFRYEDTVREATHWTNFLKSRTSTSTSSTHSSIG